jgi:hypothetical protein
MKRLGTYSVALLAVLVFGLAGNAQASTVTLTLELSSKVLNVGEVADFTLWAEVSDNGYYDGALNLGLNSASLNLLFDQPGIIGIKEGVITFPPPAKPSGKPDITLNTGQFTGLSNKPLYLDPPNKAGMANCFVSNKFVTGWDDAASPFVMLGNVDVDGAVWLASGKIEALGNGTVHLSTVVQDGLWVYKVKADESGLDQGDPDVIVHAMETVMVGGDDIPPTVIIGGPYGEGDWPATPGGWDNPLRTITLSGSATDDIGIASYEVSIAAPGSDVFVTLAAGDVVPPLQQADLMLDVTIQNIADIFTGGDPDLLPRWDPAAPYPDTYNYTLKAVVTDTIGQTGEAMTTLFVPEPGTLVLLGLGGLGALLRRRRS